MAKNRKKNNSKIITGIGLSAAILSFMSVVSPAQAKYLPLQCSSADCSSELFIKDKDLQKSYPESTPKIRLRLDSRTLEVPGAVNDTFKVLLYELDAEGKKSVISTTNVKFPKLKRNKKDLLVIADINPFVGTKTIYIDLYKSNGALATTAITELQASGNYESLVENSINTQSATTEAAAQTSANDEATLDELMFDKVVFEVDTRRAAKQTSVVKREDGKYHVSIPVVPSARREVSRRRKTKFSNEGINLSDPSINFTETPGDVSTQALTPNQTIFEEPGLFGINQDASEAFLHITPVPIANQTTIPAADRKIFPHIKMDAQALTTTPVEGAFEFFGDTNNPANNTLYFTQGGTRYRVILDEDTSSLTKLISNSVTTGEAIQYAGSANITLNGTNAVTVNFPTADGTLARLEDLVGLQTAALADGSVTNPKLADDAVDARTLATDSVTGDAIATGAVGSDEIGNGTVLEEDLSQALIDSINSSDAQALLSVAAGAAATDKLTLDSAQIVSLSANGTALNPGDSILQLNLPSADGTIARIEDLAGINVGNANIANGSITTDKLADDAVTDAKLADGAVDTAAVQDDAITSAKIDDGAVTSADIADGTILATDLDANIVVANATKALELGDATETGVITFDGLSNAVFVANANQTDVNLTLPTGDGTLARLVDLNGVSVGTGNIVDGSITNPKLADDAVDARTLATDSVTGDAIATDAVGSDEIADGSITTADLAANINVASSDEALALVNATNPGSITFDGLSNAVFVANANQADVNLTLPSADGTIARIEDLAGINVGNANIANGSITTDKLADDAVTDAKLADGAVDTAAVQDDAITSAKIDDGAVTSADIADGTILATDLDANIVVANATKALELGDATETGVITFDGLSNAVFVANANQTDVSLTLPTGDGTIARLTDITNMNAGTGNIADGAITNPKLADDAVDARTLATDSVTSDAIATGAVGSDEIDDGTVTSADIADGTILATDLDANIVVANATKALELGDATETGVITFDGLSNAVFVANANQTDVNLTLPTADGTIARLEDLAGINVGNANIANDSITTDKLANGAVTTEKLADDAVDANKLGAGAVYTAAVQDDAITSAKIDDGTITSADLSANILVANATKALELGDATETGVITFDGLSNAVFNANANQADVSLTLPAGDGTIARLSDLTNMNAGTGNIADGAITNPKLADDAVDARTLATDSVTGDAIATGAVDSDEIATDAVGSDEIADGSITAADLAANINVASSDEALALVNATNPGSITFDGLSNAVFVANVNQADVSLTLPAGDGTIARLEDLNGLGAGNIADGSITTDKLANGSVTTDKLANDAVTDAKLADNAVDTDALQNDSVTKDKLADNSVGTEEIIDGTITGDDIDNNTISFSKFDGDVVNQIKNNLNLDLTNLNLTGLTINGDNITDNSVTKADLAPDSVGTEEVINDSLLSEDIKDGTITSADIADGTITAADLDINITIPNATKALELGNATNPGVVTFDGLNSVSLASTGDANITFPAKDGTVALLSDLGNVNGGSIADGSITGDKIQDGSLTGADIADGSIEKVDLADDSVGTEEVVNNSLLSEDIADGTITGDDISDNTISFNKFDGDVVNQLKNNLNLNIADVDITTLNIGGDQITDGSIEKVDLANDSVGTEEVIDGSLTSADIADGTITAADLDINITIPNATKALELGNATNPGVVTFDGLNSVSLASTGDANITFPAKDGTVALLSDLGNVNGGSIADGSITGDKIQDGSLTGADIADGSIEKVDLADDSVGTEEVVNNSLLSEDIADGTITGDDISDNTISFNKFDGDVLNEIKNNLNLNVNDLDLTNIAIGGDNITDNSVTKTDLAPDSVGTEEVINDSLLSEDIKDGTITSADIADGTITGDDIDNSTISFNKFDGDVLNEIKNNLNLNVNDLDLTNIVIGGDNITDNSITKAKLAPNSVGTEEIINESITSEDVKNESLKGCDIKDGSLTGEDISDESLTTFDIKNGSILAEDLNPSVLAGLANGGNTNLAADSVTTVEIKNNTIIDEDVNNIDASKIKSGTIDDDRLDIDIDDVDGLRGALTNLQNQGGGVTIKADVVIVQNTNNYVINNATFGKTVEIYTKPNQTVKVFLPNAAANLLEEGVFSIVNMGKGNIKFETNCRIFSKFDWRWVPIQYGVVDIRHKKDAYVINGDLWYKGNKTH